MAFLALTMTFHTTTSSGKYYHGNNTTRVLVFVAETFLCIPASSAPSERIWSQAGLVITYKRASMGEDLASGIIFVKENRDVLTFDKAL